VRRPVLVFAQVRRAEFGGLVRALNPAAILRNKHGAPRPHNVNQVRGNSN
jgi:hypothetical protein